MKRLEPTTPEPKPTQIEWVLIALGFFMICAIAIVLAIACTSPYNMAWA